MLLQMPGGKPTHDDQRNAFVGFSADQRCGCAKLIGNRDLRDLQAAAITVQLASQIDERLQPGASDADPTNAEAERSSKAVGDQRREIEAVALLQSCAQLLRRRIRIGGQQQGAFAFVIRQVGLIDRCIGDDEAEPVPNDQHVWRDAEHLAGLSQYQLDEACVLATLRSDFERTCRRLDAVELDIAILGFRDDFLGDHEHIAIAWRWVVRVLERLGEEAGQIVARRNFRNSAYRQKAQRSRWHRVAQAITGAGRRVIGALCVSFSGAALHEIAVRSALTSPYSVLR